MKIVLATGVVQAISEESVAPIRHDVEIIPSNRSERQVRYCRTGSLVRPGFPLSPQRKVVEFCDLHTTTQPERNYHSNVSSLQSTEYIAFQQSVQASEPLKNEFGARKLLQLFSGEWRKNSTTCTIRQYFVLPNAKKADNNWRCKPANPDSYVSPSSVLLVL